jgi:hypothetical protein
MMFYFQRGRQVRRLVGKWLNVRSCVDNKRMGVPRKSVTPQFQPLNEMSSVSRVTLKCCFNKLASLSWS